MPQVKINDYIPGAIGRIAELHAIYYSREWGFGKFFEAKVATELAEFVSRLDPSRDGLWTVSLENRVQGAIAIDGIKAETDGAHLRWFILSSVLTGQGFGNLLIDRAMTFCREKAYKKVYLWTFKGLNTARHLYEKHGFTLAEEFEGNQWGTTVIEQNFILEL